MLYFSHNFFVKISENFSKTSTGILLEQISDHHANFFVNHGNARADDIMSLIKISKETQH